MSYKITLTVKQSEMLKNRQRVERNSKVLKRIQAVIMKSGGMNNAEISEMLGINVNTLTLWIKEYISNGLSGLCTLKYKTQKTEK